MKIDDFIKPKLLKTIKPIKKTTTIKPIQILL